MSRFGKFLGGGTGHKPDRDDTGDPWEKPIDYGQSQPLSVNFLRPSESGKASFFLVHLGSKTMEKWIPNALINDIENVDWNGGKCEINVPVWWWKKEGPDK